MTRCIRWAWCGLMAVWVAGAMLPMSARAQYPIAAEPPRDLLSADSPRGVAYLELRGGASFANDTDVNSVSDDEFDGLELEFDDGYNVNVAAGRYFDPIRAELELGYRDHSVTATDSIGIDIIEADLTFLTLMGNFYYDLQVHDRVDLFAGAGVGLVRMEIDGTQRPFIFSEDLKDDETQIAWQFLGGVAVHVTEDISLTGQYRLFDTNGFDFGDADIDSTPLHSIEVGVRWNF